ncbi:MAG: hypothetical protein ACTHOJ_11275, partial [Sphingomonas oligoaromativorans]
FRQRKEIPSRPWPEGIFLCVAERSSRLRLNRGVRIVITRKKARHLTCCTGVTLIQFYGIGRQAAPEAGRQGKTR